MSIEFWPAVCYTYLCYEAYGKGREIIAMKPILTIDELIQAARRFCEIESRENHIELIGVTDGKAVGTYVEHKFQHFYNPST